jgi:signal transduction histidine kinase/ActR/RegA family two-component response regulator
VIVGERSPEAARELEEATREAAYYRRIAEEAGSSRLWEAEALSQLLERAQLAERELQRARDVLERRVAELTAELTTANAQLSRVVAERERAEAALRANEETFRSFMAHFPGLAYIKEADTTMVFASEGFQTYLGLDPEALRGKTNTDCFPEPFASEITRDDLRVLASGRAEHIDEEFGGRSWRTHKFAIPKADGAPRLGGLTLDVTAARRSEAERRQLEQHMEQAQRIESLGVLAGGIAHDFNNLLTSILANVSILRADAPEGSRAADSLADVEAVARTAAGLCQQLLAYAGRAQLASELFDPGVLVGDILQLLRSSLSRKVQLELRLANGLPLVRGDPGQVRQVVMNLVINAAESMGEGHGTVTVTTSAVRAGRERLGQALLGEGLAEGDYVCLEVTDTGCGMDLAAQRRIFEPFFTTKFAGRGLGLSMVVGIVRQLGGAIELESAPGQGSRFRVLLPVSEAAAPAPSPAPAARAWTGDGLVLVVDDEPAVRRALGRMLRLLGFEMIEAASGAEGVEIYREHAGRIRAVVLDLTMPHLDGVETLRRLRQADPGAHVLVASGYAGTEVEARFRGELPDGFLQKPFGMDELREHLRAVLDRAGPPTVREGER